MSSFRVHDPCWDDHVAADATQLPQLTDDSRLWVHTQYGDLYFSIGDFGLRITTNLSVAENTNSHTDYAILKQTPNKFPLSLKQDDEHTEISAGEYRLQIGHKPLSIALYCGAELIQCSATDGHFVRRHRLPPFTKTDNGWLINLELGPEESVYGLGEKWSKLDKRGQLIRSYNHDALGVNSEKSYKNTPYAWSLKGWNVFVHTPAPVTHSVGYAAWSQRAYGLLVEDNELDVFLYRSTSPSEGINTYCDLTGFAPVPPKWSFGVILSKAYYQDAEELLATAKAVRDNKMPCDVITLDGRAWQDTDTRFAFEWDPTRYADPKLIMDQLKAMDFKICIWEYPMVSVKNPLFAKAAEKGWLLKDKRTGEAYRYQWDSGPFNEVLTPLPDSGIWDFTHPDAYQYWLDAHKDLFELGVDMIKADFGEQVEDDNMLAYSGDSGNRLHNVYSLLYNRCVYEGAKKYSKNGPFLFSRSAWTGSQCYPAQWGGDPQADWQGFAASMRGSLAWGLSGAPFFATDVGGFYKDTRDSELYVRWSQASVFSAHMRLHGIGAREPWSYGEEAGNAVMQALALRYQLLPYLQDAAETSSHTGLPLQRAMVLAFPEDILSHSFEHQFMCGEDILVVPCLQPGGEITFYLPEGDWCSFPDKKVFTGGKVYKQKLALDQIAAFVRCGTKLQLGEAVEHTEVDSASLITWEANSPNNAEENVQ
jgi:alpha-D-xyloside xylohydrolase